MEKAGTVIQLPEGTTPDDYFLEDGRYVSSWKPLKTYPTSDKWPEGWEVQCNPRGRPSSLDEWWRYVQASAKVPEEFVDTSPADKPLDVQVGGDHYKKLKIQPVVYIHANKIPFMEGSAIKYLTRWRDKGGIADLEKARHFIDMLISLEKQNVD